MQQFGLYLRMLGSLSLLSRQFSISKNCIIAAAFLRVNTIMATAAFPSSSCAASTIKDNPLIPTVKSFATSNRNSAETPMFHPIGLGTMLMERGQVQESIRTAIQTGFRRIDCAPVYFNEDAIGDALEAILNDNEGEASVRREDLFIVSKLPSPLHQNPELAVRKILNDLKLDYLDLFLSKFCNLHMVTDNDKTKTY
jgi:Aldo/keto reductase family